MALLAGRDPPYEVLPAVQLEARLGTAYGSGKPGRLENVARAVGDPHSVMAGTDCGFDTSAGMGRVTEDVVWAKLAAMAEGAKLASARLGLG